MKALILIRLFCLTLLLVTQLAYSKPLRVVTEDLPPFQVVENNKVVGGTSYFLVKQILERAGLNTTIEILPWARAYETALHDENVLIFTLVKTVERANNFHWLYKIDSIGYCYYGLKDNASLVTLNKAKLLDVTVSAVRGSFEANRLVASGFIESKNLVLTVTYKEAWDLVRLGRVDVTYASDFHAKNILNQINPSEPQFVQILKSDVKQDLYLAAGKNIAPDLLSKLQTIIKTMPQPDSNL